MRTYHADVPAIFTLLTYGVTVVAVLATAFAPIPLFVRLIMLLSILAVIWPEIRGYRAYQAQRERVVPRTEPTFDNEKP